ncbi:MAG: ATP-binding cassette domain-containing protein [Erysipelotrichaceae bacterium]|nr:ATP-binding cassette domain-containing protein [Erysipelotrichaceae bacterium]
MNNEILKLVDVSFGYNNDLILKDINLTINKGEYVGIIGLNGSGKSTLLKIILGIIKPTSGEIIKGNKIKIGYVNQTTMVEEGSFMASVFEVVSLGLKKKPFSFINKKEKEKINKTLQLFSLSEYANHSIDSLSGGQAQKVKIAKVLLSNPDIIVLDEPTSGIDESSEEILLEIIAHLHALKKTIILVSHNLSNLSNCDVVYKISDKSINKYEKEIKENA